MNNVSTQLESIIKHRVDEILSKDKNHIPELPIDLIPTDNIAEVIEKLVILHIRTWMLEDMIAVAKTDDEVGIIKKKIDICFKQKRPMYVQAINKMIDNAIVSGKGLQEDSVKIYKGVE
jgi:hypothetical protein